ncbi:MAG: MmcQ/YjbR family DNA-binding protein [Candidatus Dormibacteraeota bacterium]|nr:MmcQ/YjbR family DNA-binding protein [Candidatus Dormibacteraeota bacterium]
MRGRAAVSWCRRQADATEEFPFGPDVRLFKVGGKVFAICPNAAVPDHITLKCDPGLADRLRQDYAAITPGYHTNKRHWNTVRLDGSIPTGLVRRMLENSYGLVRATTPAGGKVAAGWTNGSRPDPKSKRRSPRPAPAPD